MPPITNEEIAVAIRRFRKTLSDEMLERDLQRFTEADEEAAYLYVNRILSDDSSRAARTVLLNNKSALKWAYERQEYVSTGAYRTESFGTRRTQIQAIL